MELNDILTSSDWRNILSSASVGNAALMESDTYVGPDMEAKIRHAFGTLVRMGVIR